MRLNDEQRFGQLLMWAFIAVCVLWAYDHGNLKAELEAAKDELAAQSHMSPEQAYRWAFENH